MEKSHCWSCLKYVTCYQAVYNILGWSHFHNMLHSKLGSIFNKPKTSYELWTQRKPKINHFMIFLIYMLCPHTHQKMKQVNSKVIKCVSLNMENKKESKGTSYMIVLFIRLFLAKMWSLMKNPCSKCENSQKN